MLSELVKQTVGWCWSEIFRLFGSIFRRWHHVVKENNTAVSWNDFSYCTNGQSAGVDQPWIPKQWFSNTECCSVVQALIVGKSRGREVEREVQHKHRSDLLCLVNLSSRGVAVYDADKQSRSFASFLSQFTGHWAKRNLKMTNRSEECAGSKISFPPSTVYNTDLWRPGVKM